MATTSASLINLVVAAFVIAAVLSLANASKVARALLALGCVSALIFVLQALPQGSTAFQLPLGMAGTNTVCWFEPSALWLLGFGLPGAFFSCCVGTPGRSGRVWAFGAAMSLLGAVGVFSVQDAVSFLVAWEVMSLGGALLLLGDDLAAGTGQRTLFMLALLETGSVALMLAFVLLSVRSGGIAFSGFAEAMREMPVGEQLFVGFLLLVGFGAKLGLLPFYEWFPGAYGAGSGASGAILSGIVINAAYFALSRCLIDWLPDHPELPVSISGVFIVTVAVISAILTSLYAFQQEGWRELLSLSSAENASIAVCLLGAGLMFHQDGLGTLAGLAWVVAQLHLAGHALAKGALFLSADGVYGISGSYLLAQQGILARSSKFFGVGALFAAMSLAAMPPQAGFVSEWYLFQTFFQGFHLAGLASRLTAALAGAGLALTAAVAFAVFIKAFGIGLLGRGTNGLGVSKAISFAVGTLGVLVLALAVGMPVWLNSLAGAAMTGSQDVSSLMHKDWLLVPLTAGFSFISPSKLIIVMPLLALVPLALLLATMRSHTQRVPVWFGGRAQDASLAKTTALTFSNALRTFYSFIYRPTVETVREAAPSTNGASYFIRRLSFAHDIAPIFGPALFAPLTRFVVALATKVRVIQSGYLNFYLSLVGFLLVVILLVALI